MRRLTVAVEVDPSDTGCFNNNSIPCKEATNALSTLDPHCQLDSIDMYIGPADLDELFLAKMLETLGALDPRVLREFEDVILRLLREGRLGHVAVSLYRAIPTEIGLDPRFFCSAGDHLRTVFPALCQAGILRV